MAPQRARQEELEDDLGYWHVHIYVAGVQEDAIHRHPGWKVHLGDAFWQSTSNPYATSIRPVSPLIGNPEYGVLTIARGSV